MTFKKKDDLKYNCLSTDIKRMDLIAGATCEEVDTGNEFYFNGTNWVSKINVQGNKVWNPSRLSFELETQSTISTDNLTVSGSMEVSNFPEEQIISGLVSVDNFPDTTEVSNMIPAVETGLAKESKQLADNHQVSVSNFPVSQAVTGTVSVDNFPGSSSQAEQVYIDGSDVYTCVAAIGSSLSSPVWQINKINTTTLTTLWCDGNASYDNLATNVNIVKGLSYS